MVKTATQRERTAPERLTYHYTAPTTRPRSKKKKQQSYEVDRIVKAKTVEGKQQFQLRWKGFKASFDSWEPATNCACDRLIQQFLKIKMKEAKKPARKKEEAKTKKAVAKTKKAVAKKAPKKKSSLTKSSSLVLSTDVDAHAAEEIAAGFAVLQEGTCVWSAMLKCIDIEQNMDKFYVLQVLYKGDKAVFFTRWGRSGTVGQQERMTFETAGSKSLAAAKKAFESKFKAKTSFDWAKGKGLNQGRGRQGKYSPITVASSEEGDGKWQYYQDNHMDGKAPGWYDYVAAAVPTVEGVYVDWKNNPGENLNVRCVQSGHFSYRINFDQMCQTNLSSQRERPIRRI